MTDTFLPRLLAGMEMCVLLRTTEGRFFPLQPAPDFMRRLFPESMENGDRGWDLSSSPFLQFFASDAEAHWRQGAAEPLWSGPWTETSEGAGPNDEDNFQAAALNVGGEPVLVLSRITGEDRTRNELLQHARENLLLQRYLEEEIENRTRSIREREEELVLRLICVSDYRHEETGAHIKRIGLYAAALARAWGWSNMQQHKIKLAACMHDIGKIGIPDGILLKPARLTPEEFEIIKGHTTIGGRMLEGSDILLLQMARDIALCHHENWDGSGYPAGLAGEDIPLPARITTLCDVYDALVHTRVYRESLPEEAALSIMESMRGVKFDPALLDLFMENLPRIREIRRSEQDEPGKVGAPLF